MSSRRRPIIIAAVVAAVVVVLGVFVVTRLLDNEVDAENRFVLNEVRLPDEIEPQFTIGAVRAYGAFGRITALNLAGDTIVQYDENGDERWSTEVPERWQGATLAPEVGGFLPVQFQTVASQDGGAVPDAAIGFVDVDSGKITTTEIPFSSQEQFQVWPLRDRLYLISDTKIELFDPESGALIAAAEGTKVIPGLWNDSVFVVNANTTSAYDRDLQPILTGVEIDRPGFSIATFDDAVVAVDGDQILGKNETGVAWTIDTGFAALRSAVPVATDRWLVELPDADAALIDTSGDRVTELWRGSGLLFAANAGEGRVLINALDRVVLLDSDGNELFEAAGGIGDFNRVLENGIVFRPDGAAGDQLTFVDFDGNEQWTIETSDENLLALSFVDDAVFDPGTRTVYGPK